MFNIKSIFLSLIVLVITGCGNDQSGSSTPDNIGGSIQNLSLTLDGAVTTFVGSADELGSTDAVGVDARFYGPSSITTDGTNLYIADTYNDTIRKVNISTKIVSTVAGSVEASGSTDGVGLSARFNYPQGITTDGINLYVADTFNHTIRKILLTNGTVTTLAGSPGVEGSDDGNGASAKFKFPRGITTDRRNLYITDENDVVRQIVIATGVVTTLAGSAGESGYIDGIGQNARFFTPAGITTDGTNLYLTDVNNLIIRKINISTREVSSLAGIRAFGSTDGFGVDARFNFPMGITTDGINLYVADTYNETIRKIVISNSYVTTLAGSAGVVGADDGLGSAASFNYPNGITTDGNALYVTDVSSHIIRQIN